MVEQFPIVLRGYDKERVDEAFALAQETVDRLRDQVKADDQTILELQAQLQEEKNKKANPNSFASLGANAQQMLASAEQTSAELLDRAKKDASAARATVQLQAETLLNNAKLDAKRILDEANAKAEAVLSKANNDADTLKSNAQREADQLRGEAQKAGELLVDNDFQFDKAYTSYLKRAVKTLDVVLDRMDQDWIPVEKSWRLNEKHYGQLQGLNKADPAEKYGEEQVLVWRRSYDVAPHALAEDDPRNPRFEVRYNEVPDAELPRTESLKDTIERIMPYWKCVIFPNLKTADELLVVAHGNSLRGIIKHLKGISDEDIVKLNLPTAVPYVFEFDDDLNLTKDYFLGDPEEIKKLMEAVANQGKK